MNHFDFTAERQQRNEPPFDWKPAAVVLLLVLLCGTAFSVMKQTYGGNIKIAEDLTAGLTHTFLFEADDQDQLRSLQMLNLSVNKTRLEADLSTLPADRITELEQSISALDDESNACHWILDYPYFHHEHGNSISIEKDRLLLETREPEFLSLLAQSSCLLPGLNSFLTPFVKTQFGYEANQKCITGRPFLDSVSPVVIDLLNPYLAFKLNEVDAFSIPEDKFRQISADEQIQVISGLQYYIFLKSENLSAAQMLSLTSALDVREISQAALNGHAQIFLSGKGDTITESWKTPVYFKTPEESPFRLIGDRLRIQLQNGGFSISTKALAKNAPTLELVIKQVKEPDLDLFRYRLMREDLEISGETNSFEQWDELEAAGKIVPLMLYESKIAIRKNLVDVRSGAGGMPDFSNAWILPEP